MAQTVREDAGKILEALGYGAAEVFCTMKRTSFALARMGTSAACWDINRKLRETPVLRKGKRIWGGPASPRRSGSARDGSATSPAWPGTTSTSRTAPRASLEPDYRTGKLWYDRSCVARVDPTTQKLEFNASEWNRLIGLAPRAAEHAVTAGLENRW